ncbi:MAG: methyltransferase domain-containing protein [Coleofasciculus sp. C1-SOL-03]|uniref:class I SAM-dependent methyltransferase n=1 Tax=Coleofasciculus sp. C1-SOL-03 TaxID=3069522 RepID=UPI0032F8ABF9
MSSSPTYLDPIILPLLSGATVLDVGCGYGRWGHLIQSNFWEAGLTEPPQVDGFDAFLPNVEFCSKHSCYRKVWHQVMPSPLTGTWDTVLACEFIEHIEQKAVEEVIEILEGAAKKRVIFSTPNWPYYRGGGDTILGYNDLEAHLSYVSRDFFGRRGYTLIGAGFGNPTNLVVRAVKKLKFSWEPALQSIPRMFPKLGHSLVAYKNIT